MSENLTDKITSLMFGLSRNIMHRMKNQYLASGLSFAQITALRCLAENSRMTMKELAECMQITPPSTTSLVNGLVKDGYVTRKTGSRDRRAVYLAMTSKGQLFNNRCFKAKEKTMTALIRNLNMNEQKKFADILQKINDTANLPRHAKKSTN